MIARETSGLARLLSSHSVGDTLARLENALTRRGIPVFCRIDHAAGAEAAGLHMRAATVVIFGNPRAGTAIMIDAPSAAIDLPIKVLVSEDDEGRVWLTWNTPEYLRERHHITVDLGPLQGAETIFAEVAGV